MRIAFIVMLCLAAVGCTHTYQPNRYELTVDRIPPVQASGEVSILNVQGRTGSEQLFGMGVHKYVGDHQVITQAYADQLAKAMSDVGVRVVAGEAPKRLEVAVNSITAWTAFFHFKGKITITVVTGDRERFDIIATNGSPGNIWRTLNGTIAIAVLETLKHPGVQAYLARPGGPVVVSQR